MPTATIAGYDVQINDEGFLTEYDEWNEEIGAVLAENIGVTMTDEHWALIKWLREDYKEKGETATTRRADRRRLPRQAAVPDVPQETGQEDVVRRRAP